MARCFCYWEIMISTKNSGCKHGNIWRLLVVLEGVDMASSLLATVQALNLTMQIMMILIQDGVIISSLLNDPRLGLAWPVLDQA